MRERTVTLPSRQRSALCRCDQSRYEPCDPCVTLQMREPATPPPIASPPPTEAEMQADEQRNGSRDWE